MIPSYEELQSQGYPFAMNLLTHSAALFLTTKIISRSPVDSNSVSDIFLSSLQMKPKCRWARKVAPKLNIAQISEHISLMEGLLYQHDLDTRSKFFTSSCLMVKYHCSYIFYEHLCIGCFVIN